VLQPGHRHTLNAQMSMVPSSPSAMGISVTSGSTGIDLGTLTCIVINVSILLGEQMHRARSHSRRCMRGQHGLWPSLRQGDCLDRGMKAANLREAEAMHACAPSGRRSRSVR